MLTRFASTTRDMLRIALNEARGRGDSIVGTDHLLVALLHDPALASGVLGRRTPDDARTALRERDSAALLAAGVDADTVASTGLAVDDEARLPLSAGTRHVFEAARRITTAQGRRRVQPHDLLAALASRATPDPGLDLLVALGLDPARIATDLAA